MLDVLDVHTHTYASGHAYSTMREVIDAAKTKGLKLIGISDHAPNMPGSAHEFHFLNLKAVPRNAYGIKLVIGAELNIIDYDGSIDLSDESLKSLDYAIASLHPPCIKSGTIEDNTAAIINVMRIPKVIIIGHPDNPVFPVDFDMVAKAAKDNKVMLEVNSSSYVKGGYREGSRENAAQMLKACQKYGTEVIMGSDAHIDFDVANHKNSIEVITQNNFPEELVVNSDIERFYKYVKNQSNEIIKTTTS